MNIQSQKLNLIERLLLLQDKNLINKIEKLLCLPDKKSHARLKQMTLDEFYERVEASEKAIREEKTISQKALEKEADNW
jgi:hypothetical protein